MQLIAQSYNGSCMSYFDRQKSLVTIEDTLGNKESPNSYTEVTKGITKTATGCTCWEGYKRVAGTAPCSEGSCVKKNEAGLN